MNASEQVISAQKFTPPDNTWNSHTRVQWVVSHLASNPIEDIVLEGRELDFTFTANDTGIAVQFLNENQETTRWSIHYHAFKQLCQKVGFPPFYGSSLLKENTDWAEDLVASNLRELFWKRASDKAFLLRSVKGQLRGFLTNAYKRLNTEKLIEVFATTCSKHGASPYDGIYTPIRIGIQAATNESFKVAGRNLRIGVMMRNSDFGAGALEVQFFLSPGIGLAIVSKRGIRRVHKGHRLSRVMEENERLEQRDISEASASVQKLVEVHLDPYNIQAAMAEVQLAAETDVDPDKVSDMLETLHMSKDDVEQTKEAFLGSNDPRIPAGNTMLRLASTIAWLGSTCGDPEKQLDLQELAGTLILKGR